MRIKLIFIFFCLVPNMFAQLKNLSQKQIGVDWYKTTHLIFPSDIKYFSTVDNYIVADDNGRILSIKANERNFKGISTLSVATAEGQFYTYSIRYQDNLIETNLFVKSDSTIIPEKINVNSKNAVHLIFPSEVKYIDFGSDEILAAPAEGLQNVVRISAEAPFSTTTNVSVATADGEFYTYDVIYDSKETNFTYTVGEQPAKVSLPAILKKEDLTDNARKEITEKIENKGRTIYNMGLNKNKVMFSIHNIFVRDNKLIFRVEIQNNSNIKYDIDYIKFYIVDKKKNKKTASQDIETMPLFIDNYVPLIPGKQNQVFSVCFEKFTIPDNKYFLIEINELNGGRHVNYKLGNNDIINAESL